MRLVDVEEMLEKFGTSNEYEAGRSGAALAWTSRGSPAFVRCWGWRISGENALN